MPPGGYLLYIPMLLSRAALTPRAWFAAFAPDPQASAMRERIDINKIFRNREPEA